MREAQSKTIDGFAYTVNMLPAGKAQRWLVRILKVVAPSAAAGMAGVTSLTEMLNGETSKLGIGAAVATLSDRLDESMLDELTKELADQTVVTLEGGNQPSLSSIYEVHFAGRMKANFSWLGFALKVQYSDFLEGLGNLQDVAQVILQGMTKVESGSPTNSTDGSGDS